MGLLIGLTALEATATLLDSPGLDDAGSAVVVVQQWITQRSDVLKHAVFVMTEGGFRH